MSRYDEPSVILSGGPVAVPAAVDMFRTYVQVQARDFPDSFERWIEPLRGRDLACWCPLDQPCHADVLLEVANP
jgi:hypothetical protein